MRPGCSLGSLFNSGLTILTSISLAHASPSLWSEDARSSGSSRAVTTKEAGPVDPLCKVSIFGYLANRAICSLNLTPPLACDPLHIPCLSTILNKKTNLHKAGRLSSTGLFTDKHARFLHIGQSHLLSSLLPLLSCSLVVFWPRISLCEARISDMCDTLR